MNATKGLVLLLCLATLTRGAQAQDVDQEIQPTPSHVTTDANLHRGPSRTSPIVATLKATTGVEIIGHAHGWLRVSTKTKIGWISKELLREPESALPETESGAPCAPNLASCSRNGCATTPAEQAINHLKRHQTAAPPWPAGVTGLLLRQRIAGCLFRQMTVLLLEIASTIPASQNRRLPRIQPTLRCLATKARDTCGPLLTFRDFLDLQRHCLNDRDPIGEGATPSPHDRQTKLRNLTLRNGRKAGEGDSVMIAGYLTGTPH